MQFWWRMYLRYVRDITSVRWTNSPFTSGFWLKFCARLTQPSHSQLTSYTDFLSLHANSPDFPFFFTAPITTRATRGHCLTGNVNMHHNKQLDPDVSPLLWVEMMVIDYDVLGTTPTWTISDTPGGVEWKCKWLCRSKPYDSVITL